MKKVILLESDVVTARRMRSLWKAAGFDVRLVTNFEQAAFEAVQWAPDLIALDTEGVEDQARNVLLQLQARPQTSRIPVVLFTSKGTNKIPEALLHSVRTIVDLRSDPDQILQKVPELALAVVG